MVGFFFSKLNDGHLDVHGSIVCHVVCLNISYLNVPVSRFNSFMDLNLTFKHFTFCVLLNISLLMCYTSKKKFINHHEIR